MNLLNLFSMAPTLPPKPGPNIHPPAPKPGPNVPAPNPNAAHNVAPKPGPNAPPPAPNPGANNPAPKPPIAPGTGWLPESYDARDKPYRSQERGRVEQSVNLAKENPQWLEPVYDQVHTGSCVANATAAAYRYCVRKMNSDNKSKIPDNPSRLFIYYNARLLPAIEEQGLTTKSADPPKEVPFPEDNLDPRGGSTNRAAFKAINIWGVCPETSWKWKNVDVEVTDDKGQKVMKQRPENLNKCPDDAAYKDAKSARTVEYCRLDPDHPVLVERDMSDEERKAVGIVTLLQLKQCLTEGYPVVFGFKLYWKPLPWKQDEKTKEWYLDPLPPEFQHNQDKSKVKSGHAVLCVGYDNDRKQVLVQNSWGPGNGIKGGSPRFWMPYNYITDWECTDDFWMVRLIEERSEQKKI